MVVRIIQNTRYIAWTRC